MELCPCGQPLHYGNEATQRMVEDMIKRLGVSMPVVVDGRTWMVPRHWIALHGLLSADIPLLAVVYGWPEVSR